MTNFDTPRMVAARERLWKCVEEADVGRLALLFTGFPKLTEILDELHPHSPWADDPTSPVLSATNPLAACTPIHYAARMGYKDVCIILLANGAAPDNRVRDENGLDSRLSYATPLTLAAEQGRFDMVRFLLEHGADPNGRHWETAKDKDDGDTDDGPSRLSPLHFAVLNHDEATVGLLLERGAVCDLPDFQDKTPLWHAAVSNAIGVTRRLMTAGGDETRQCGGWGTPWEVAIQCNPNRIVPDSVVLEETIPSVATEMEAHKRRVIASSDDALWPPDATAHRGKDRLGRLNCGVRYAGGTHPLCCGCWIMTRVWRRPGIPVGGPPFICVSTTPI